MSPNRFSLIFCYEAKTMTNKLLVSSNAWTGKYILKIPHMRLYSNVSIINTSVFTG